MAQPIRTSRLILTPLAHVHAEDIIKIRSNEQAMFWNPREIMPLITTHEAAIEWIDRIVGSSKNPYMLPRYAWAVSLPTAPEQMFGTVTILGQSAAEDEAHTESHDVGQPIYFVGYMLLPEAWSQGYATEAVKAALEAVTPAIQGAKLSAWISGANKGSLRVIKKLGFGYEKIKRFSDGTRFLGGEWRDDFIEVYSRYA